MSKEISWTEEVGDEWVKIHDDILGEAARCRRQWNQLVRLPMIEAMSACMEEGY